jgi:hypothetical protein
MYPLAVAFPYVRRLRPPFTRDQAMLLMMAVNELFLGLDTLLAHNLSGTLRPFEWIPIVFGPAAGVVLLLAGLIALRRRPLASTLATLVFLSSMLVGVLGAYFHIARAVLPDAPAGQRVSLDLFVLAPPVLGPLAFALVGVLGISAAWTEDPPDSGALLLPGGLRLQLPYPKTQAYFFAVSMGILVALVSSVLDHARAGFDNVWLWLPTAAGAFGMVVAALLGAIDRPTRGDLLTYIGAMLVLIVVGGVGALLHAQSNLGLQNAVIAERFLRGAPFMAPLLYCNMGMLGLIALLDPAEGR